MEGKRLLRTLRLTNLLSYGPEGEEIELQPLNVLIGPNGSGKSNLIEAIGLLKAAPSDISVPIRAGEGFSEWTWKGEEEEESSNSEASPSVDIKIETVVSRPKGAVPLRYRFRLASVGQRLEVADEAIEEAVEATPGKRDRYLYRDQDGQPVLTTSQVDSHAVSIELGERSVRPKDISLSQSILSQRKDPERYPELSYLGNVFSEIRLFRGCSLGVDSPLRGPQRADQPSDFLLEDGRNLGIVLNDLLNRPPTKKRLLDELRRFYEPADDLATKIYAGTVDTYLHEHGFGIPAARLSGGTLRYLCLLVVLCHPSPPPLVCIEDPEIGLHPDILPRVGDLLIEASSRMQLVVTTHSDVLVSALSDVSEAVIVCEKDHEETRLKRLEPKLLADWLEKYSLGELWRMGETGGNP